MADDAWSAEEVRRLRKYAKFYTAEDYERNERWRKIADKIDGRSKRDCYEKYKDLKAARAQEKEKEAKESALRAKLSSAASPISSRGYSNYSSRNSSGMATPLGYGDDASAKLTSPQQDALNARLQHLGIDDDKKPGRAEGRYGAREGIYQAARRRGGGDRTASSLSDRTSSSLSRGIGPRPAASTRPRPSAESKRGNGGGGGGMEITELEVEDFGDEDFDDPSPSANPSDGYGYGGVRRGSDNNSEVAPGEGRRSSGLRPSLGGVGAASPITMAEARALRLLLLGDENKKLSRSWMRQGLFFRGESSERSTRGDRRWPEVRGLGFGIIQIEGGPCGPLAVIQAELLRALLFGRSTVRNWADPDPNDRDAALVEAMAEILWRCRGRSGAAAVCIEGMERQFDGGRHFSADGLTERLLVHRPESKSELTALLAVPEVLGALRRPTGHGIALFVISAILSRGPMQVLLDMKGGLDGGSPKLIETHNYASQELVNLLLCGCAHSQVFDGNQYLSDKRPEGGDDEDSGDGVVTEEFFDLYHGRGGGKEDDDDITVLRGIPSRCDVGFLTLFEAYEYMEVGQNLKEPRCPIWVICSESHYSVLFSPEDNVRGVLEVYYYDELGDQEEEIRLGLDPKPRKRQLTAKEAEDSTELVPPIDLVIRTRWRGAAVDWNGSEPIL